MPNSPVGGNAVSLKEDIFLKALKDTTAADHEALERLPLSVSVTNPAVTLKDYSNYLEHMWPFVQDLEENIYPLLIAIVPDIDQRRKRSLILEDLHVLGAHIPRFFSWPFTSVTEKITTPFALGIMYVMEGSTLGGKFIGNNIQQALGYNAESGAQYFAGYGAATGSMWKAFLGYLSHYQKTNNTDEEIFAGANYAFRTIHDYFKG